MTLNCWVGWGNVVGIATGYRLDNLGIGSRWGQDFSHLSRHALGPTQPSAQWVLYFLPWRTAARA
jgi:hypothetical protein